jgi:hypothetical protein
MYSSVDKTYFRLFFPTSEITLQSREKRAAFFSLYDGQIAIKARP